MSFQADSAKNLAALFLLIPLSACDVARSESKDPALGKISETDILDVLADAKGIPPYKYPSDHPPRLNIKSEEPCKPIGTTDYSTPEKSMLTDAERLVSTTSSGKYLLQLSEAQSFYWCAEEIDDDKSGVAIVDEGKILVNIKHGSDNYIMTNVLSNEQNRLLSSQQISSRDKQVSYWAAVLVHEMDHMLRAYQSGFDYRTGDVNLISGGNIYKFSFSGVDYAATRRLSEFLAEYSAYNWAINLANQANGNPLPLAMVANISHYDDLRFLKQANAINQLDIYEYASVFFAENGQSLDWKYKDSIDGNKETLVTTEANVVTFRQYFAKPLVDMGDSSLAPQYLTAKYLLSNIGTSDDARLAIAYLRRLDRPLTESEQAFVK